MHRQIPGRICRATITKSKSCRYFVSILVETKYKPLPKTGKQIGLDLGIQLRMEIYLKTISFQINMQDN